MSEAKHTPGPLRVITPANSDGEFPIEKDDGSMEPVAFVVSKNEADAHLFAAAPEMLDACKQAAALHEDDEGIAQVLLAAIAKAEAQS